MFRSLATELCCEAPSAVCGLEEAGPALLDAGARSVAGFGVADASGEASVSEGLFAGVIADDAGAVRF